MGSQNHIYSKKKLVKLKQGQSNTGRRLQPGHSPVMRGNQRGKRWGADPAQGAGQSQMMSSLCLGLQGWGVGSRSYKLLQPPPFGAPNRRDVSAASAGSSPTPQQFPTYFLEGGMQEKASSLPLLFHSCSCQEVCPIPPLPPPHPTSLKSRPCPALPVAAVFLQALTWKDIYEED